MRGSVGEVRERVEEVRGIVKEVWRIVVDNLGCIWEERGSVGEVC